MPSASTRRIRWSCAETVGNAGAYERGPCLCCQINPVELIAGELRHPEGGFIRGEPQTIGLAEALQHGRDGGLVRSQVVDAAPRLCGRSLEVGEVQAALSLKLPVSVSQRGVLSQNKKMAFLQNLSVSSRHHLGSFVLFVTLRWSKQALCSFWTRPAKITRPLSHSVNFQNFDTTRFVLSSFEPKYFQKFPVITV